VWASLLRPGGYAVIVLQPWRRADGMLVDLPTAVPDAAVRGGLVPVDRCVALITTVDGRGSRPYSRRATGVPVAVAGHHNVLVFRAPQPHEDSQAGTRYREAA
jgi:hypothetical protein